ncbi:hypothetical protein [Aquimarina sp. AU474]|uniref:hypothetical protein n=1 Tax=Aquimarina sp. AU474 TaxID=2108529 RepID=UPI000D699F75|nr:hypothetical protein [Aquimarina sp. AU474]
MVISSNSKEKDLKEMHFDALEWKSTLQFIEEEMLFINQLLHSYVFEPTTPNLFERLQEFKLEIKNIEKQKEKLHEEIQKHENQLSGVFECDTISCDHYYYKEHEILKKHFSNFYKRFRMLKSEVFGYTGGILKNNKMK